MLNYLSGKNEKRYPYSQRNKHYFLKYSLSNDFQLLYNHMSLLFHCFFLNKQKSGSKTSKKKNNKNNIFIVNENCNIKARII